MRQFWQDLKFGARTLAKSPGFTFIAVLALALGIGVNSAVFTLANVVIFKGYPVDDPDKILYINLKNTKSPNPDRADTGVSYPDFRDWRAQAKSFESMTVWSGDRVSFADANDLPDTLFATHVGANCFGIIRQKPALGRDFAEGEDAAGASPVAILSYGLWERRYGRDQSVIGRVVRVNGIPTTVIGVMPKGFTYPVGVVDLWLPVTSTARSETRDARDYFVTARLADGRTLQSARAEMETISRNLQKEYPGTNQGLETTVRTVNEFFIGPELTTIFGAMLGAVGFVLLIAAANVANLLLARALARAREISIRMAMGAGRRHIIRQLLVESVMLSTMGGLLGWLIAIVCVRAFDISVTPYGKPAWLNFSMDYRALIYLIAISIGTGILFGLAPALRLARIDINTALKDGGRGASAGRQGKRLSNILVVAEMALAVVLLTGAGLMVRTFLNVYRAPLGVSTANVLTMRLILPESRYPKSTDQILFHERLKTRLQALPGVAAVDIANFLPTGGSEPFQYELEGAAPADPQRRPSISSLTIGPDYFQVMDLRPVSGRVFSAEDGASGPPTAIVNQRFATTAWPGEDPVGKRLRLFPAGAPGPWLMVVGIVPNIVQNDISPRQIDALMYVSYRQKPAADMAIVARTSVPPGSMGTAFRRQIQQLDSDLPVYNLWTMQERLERNYWFFRIFGVMFGAFAGIALFLASIGLYAVMSHSVSQRTQEIGMRMAMGSTAQRILYLLFSEGMLRAAIGLALGLVGAFGLTRILKSILVQVSPGDPVTFVIAVFLLAAAAALGCSIPALRAMRVDPMEALRHE